MSFLLFCRSRLTDDLVGVGWADTCFINDAQYE